MKSLSSRRVGLIAFGALAWIANEAGFAHAAAKAKKSPVIGVVTEGVAERLGSVGKGKKKKKTSNEVGRTFTAVCDGALAAWKVSDLGDDGAWVGSFVSGGRPRRCMLIEGSADSVKPAKGRPTPSAAQQAAAKAAAVAALTPKNGEAPSKVDMTVFHDGEDFVAVAQTTHSASSKSNCLDHGVVVVLVEEDSGWKPLFRPQGKSKDVCGYSFFTRGDVDADGRDEIALRVDKSDGYGYRVLKRVKGSYSVLK